MDQKLSKGRTEFVKLVAAAACGILCQDYPRVVLALISRVILLNYTVDGGIW